MKDAGVLGIDLAARPEKTYACVLQERRGRLVAKVFPRCDDRVLRELAQGQAKVGIDAPFGWPNAFVDALAAHRAGRPWPEHDDDAPERLRAALSFRETDRAVMSVRRPLSVSADRLGATAMRCAVLLHRWSLEEEVDRSGLGRFVEVYPAAALVRWGFAGGRYKNRHREVLTDLVDRFRREIPALDLCREDWALCAANDDAFDAVVAALVARAALLGLTEPPPAGCVDCARQEGWIHLPFEGSLSELGASMNRGR